MRNLPRLVGSANSKDCDVNPFAQGLKMDLQRFFFLFFMKFIEESNVQGS